MTRINTQNIGQEKNCKNVPLKCGSLNVCGLKRKLQYPEFRELVCNYDLFCVMETKLDKHDIVTVPGYTFLSQPRRQKFLRRSGGLGFFCKRLYFTPHKRY